MARSKIVTGGFVFSGIWLIIGTVWLVLRNSNDARYANAVARNSCRGQEDFAGCLDAYYAVNPRPAIEWGTMALELCAGLAVIWAIVFVVKMVRGDKADPE